MWSLAECQEHETRLICNAAHGSDLGGIPPPDQSPFHSINGSLNVSIHCFDISIHCFDVTIHCFDVSIHCFRHLHLRLHFSVPHELLGLH